MLSRLFARWAKSVQAPPEKPPFESLDKLGQAERLIEETIERVAGQKPFDLIKASATDITCIDSNILKFTTRLNFYADTLASGAGIEREATAGTPVNTTLDRFFVDDDGKYIPLTAFDAWLDACQRLFDEIAKIRKVNADDVSYISRFLNRQFVHIANICKGVEEAQS